MSNQAFVSDTVTGQDSTARLRLINFPAYGSNMLPAHRAALATLVANEVAGKVVEDVFINGYAYNDHAVGMQRAEVVANEFVRLAPWLASSVAKTHAVPEYVKTPLYVLAVLRGRNKLLTAAPGS